MCSFYLDNTPCKLCKFYSNLLVLSITLSWGPGWKDFMTFFLIWKIICVQLQTTLHDNEIIPSYSSYRSWPKEDFNDYILVASEAGQRKTQTSCMYRGIINNLFIKY